jgi:heme oxygenase
LSAHDYPAPIARTLSEALVLAALLGSLLKEAEGQLTIQAQTESGIVDLLVVDYRDGELRGYVRFDPERLGELPTHRDLAALFGKGYLAITFDHPLAEERYQGIVPLEGASLGGRLIARAVERGLGIGPESGAAFFIGDGPATPARWKRVLAWFDELAAAGARADEIVRSASETFHTLTRWADARGALR